MKQANLLTPPLPDRTLRPLSDEGGIATLRLRQLMNEQQRIEIGQRIRELREASPHTNRSIADYVGVGERAVANWIAGGGIAWENAKKVAELFGVDPHWLWSGSESHPSRELDDRLSAIERAVEQLVESVARLADDAVPETAPGRQSQHQAQRPGS